ncbi:hypothetical protein HMPREF9441_01835 [Paraprevotella clara YIT 11840]|uniref:Uncharacterized protein n=1 Tax=Paraprevotella clara YIT 11840 TaxID=762968 RepID=G5SR45_9BACT|nr:hypothetical protein HMPREF9441_01835 [Paraprevotella clara YIT 11840]
MKNQKTTEEILKSVHRNVFRHQTVYSTKNQYSKSTISTVR